jgi:hypothetical protein
MALADRLKAAAGQFGRTLGEVARAGVAGFAAVSRPPVVATPFEAPDERDLLEKALKRNSGSPTGAEFDPLDAYGRITSDGAMTGAHPGSGTPQATLERLARVSVPAVVINHILDEIDEFCHPQTSPHTYGFKIALDDEEKEPTARQKKRMVEITKVILNGGGKYQSGGFSGVCRRGMRGSLVQDMFPAQILMDGYKQPCGMFVYDATTIRRREPTADYISSGRWGEDPGYVQWIDQRKWAEWDAEEFICGIRWPRADNDAFGYGWGELDQIQNLVSSFARTENYNTVNFTSGIHATHLLAMISAMDRESFSSYRRIFEANFSGPNQKRRLPVVQLDPELKEDVKSIQLGNTNAEMEYSNWLNYQVKLICATYGVDPAAALGMNFGAEGQTSSLGSSSPADRYEQSKSHGIRVKLRQLASWITPMVKMMDPDMHLEFGGFESITEQDKLDMDIKQMANFVTVNEIRARYDLEPIDGPAGDVIANPYVSQTQQMEAQMAAGVGPDGQPGAGGGQDDGGQDSGQDPFGQGQHVSQMTDQALMNSLHADTYMPNGGTIDSISKASVSKYNEALRRKLIAAPSSWRPGKPWAAVPQKGRERPPIVVSVGV